MRVTKKEFADLAGVKAPTIYNGVKHGWLTETVGGFMQLDCPTNTKYLKKKGVDVQAARAEVIDSRPEYDPRPQVKSGPRRIDAPIAPKVEKPVKAAGSAPSEKTETIQYGYAMTPKAQKEVEKLQIDIDLKKIDLKTKRGELIDRTRTITFLFLHLDILHKNILNMPIHTVDRVIALAQSGKTSAKREIIDYLTRYLSKALKDAKDLVIKTDKELMGKTNDDSDEKS